MFQFLQQYNKLNNQIRALLGRAFLFKEGFLLAIGSAVTGLVSVAAGQPLDIRPPAGSEWIIHNVKYNGAVSLNDTDGTNVLKWGSDTSAGGQLGATFHATNSYYLRIINTGSSSILVSYDGIQTK